MGPRLSFCRRILLSLLPLALASGGSAGAQVLPWRVVPAPSPGRPWSTIAEPVPDPRPAPELLAEDVSPAATPVVRDTDGTDPWIIGIGGGARIGVGEPTYPMVYGRVGRKLNQDVSLSLRPRYIFGNSDLQGQSNNQGAFQMPLTVDLRPDFWLSPYVGGGIATRTDSTGETNGMFSIGFDIGLNSALRVDLGMNYIFQSQQNDQDGGDIELTSVLYLRF